MKQPIIQKRHHLPRTAAEEELMIHVALLSALLFPAG
jgi:hypothetical protein